MSEPVPRPPTCRSFGDGPAGVWVSYKDTDRATALPGAGWDNNLKCWRVPLVFQRAAVALVEQLNDGVDSTLSAALVTVFRDVPAEPHQTTYRPLTNSWYPGGGSDTRATKALTAAWAEVSR